MQVLVALVVAFKCSPWNGAMWCRLKPYAICPRLEALAVSDLCHKPAAPSEPPAEPLAVAAISLPRAIPEGLLLGEGRELFELS